MLTNRWARLAVLGLARLCTGVQFQATSCHNESLVKKLDKVRGEVESRSEPSITTYSVVAHGI